MAAPGKRAAGDVMLPWADTVAARKAAATMEDLMFSDYTICETDEEKECRQESKKRINE
jgi:hypothetical protein